MASLGTQLDYQNSSPWSDLCLETDTEQERSDCREESKMQT